MTTPSAQGAGTLPCGALPHEQHPGLLQTPLDPRSSHFREQSLGLGGGPRVCLRTSHLLFVDVRMVPLCASAHHLPAPSPSAAPPAVKRLTPPPPVANGAFGFLLHSAAILNSQCW
jgi:hypothetical protein